METGIARRASHAGFKFLMNSMPRIVRWIAFLLIGPPGGIAWLFGVVILFAAIASTVGGQVKWPETPFGLLGGALIAIIGFAMMVCSEILLGTPRYRVPWARFAVCVGLDALVIHLTLFAAGLFVCAFLMLINGKLLGCILFAATGAFLVWVRSLTDRRWKFLRSKWQLEQHPASLTAHPSTVDETQDY